MKLMYISSGEMGLFDEHSTRRVPSQRAEQYARTLRQLEQQYAWKTEGEGAKFMHQSNPYAHAADNMQAMVTGIAPGSEGIIYAIALSGTTGSMHTKNPLDNDEPEGLITSAASFRTRDLCMHKGALYFSIEEQAGSHIAKMDPSTGRYEMLTEGDTVERHPHPASGGRLYFDMRGYARDSEQNIIGCSPSAIVELDTLSGEIRELYSAADTEYTKYTEAADGTRRMLARPHRSQASGSNPLGCLVAPFSALAGFIHFFSSINAARKGKQPPMQTSASEAVRPLPDKMTINGAVVDLKQLTREQKQHPDEYAGLVPRDWRLVAIRPDGSTETLQHGVLDYLPLDDGGYLYSNGTYVFRVDACGKRSLLFKAHLATDLMLLPENN